MDGSNLSISALKDKISSKLSSGKSNSASKKNNSKTKDVEQTSDDSKNDKSKGSSKSNKQTTGEKKEKKAKKDKKDKKAKAEPSTKKEAAGGAGTSDNSGDVLRREALALGVTEEDLKLVENVDEEAELETEVSGNGGDKKLTADLSNFMNGLGFTGEVDIAEDEDEDDGEIEEKVEAKKEKKPEKQKEPEVKPKAAKKAEPAPARQAKEKKQKQEKVQKTEKPKEDDSTVQVAEMRKEKKPATSDKINDLSSVKSDKLAIECRIDWYNVETIAVDEPEKLDRFAVERLTEKAQALVESENKTYLNEFTSVSSQKKFLSQILSDGTLNDKISALTLLVQEAPFHNLKAFDTLLSYCEKKSRTASLQAINALKDLFLNGLLPDRKLLSFSKQALNKNADVKTLALYYFEDHLKKSYFKFIQVLEFLSHDPILHVRMNVVSHIFDLLKAKPEQEANLLRLGVNKLGDVENKVAAKTSYQILQLEETHPAMKKIVTDSVTDMVLQKKHDYHSQYYTILTLNQTILSRKDVDLANSLVKTYFSLFEKILVESDPALKDKAEDKVLGKSERGRKNNRKAFKKGKKGGKSVKVEEKSEEEVVEERSAKMFSALLTGLNRAFPYADLPSETYSSHLNTLYKITHSTNFNTSVQALVLVQQIISQQDLDSARFYRTLYESLMDPRLVNSSKQGIYLNLLFKSLKNDIRNIPRVLAFVKRILQICCHWINVGAITGMFFLLMELSKTHPQILELMEAEGARPETLTSNDSEKKGNDEEYDPKKRDPEYANAHKSNLWEMSSFVNHYHPSVSIYASSLIDGTPQPKPDLGLFSLAHFLDRFVYKNAKQKNNAKGSSIMQPLGGGHSGSLLVRATNVQSSDVPVNTVDWLSKKADSVRPDEKFFFDYFTRNEKKIRTQKSRKAGDEDDDEDEALGEDQVWDALVKSRPDVEGSDDDGLSDFDEEDFGDMSDLSDDDGEAEGLEGIKDIDDELEEFDDDEALGDGSDAEGSIDDAFNQLGDEDAEQSEADVSTEEESTTSKKRKSDGEEKNKKKKKTKFSSMPTFASAEDYAQYLQSDDEF